MTQEKCAISKRGILFNIYFRGGKRGRNGIVKR